MTETNQTKLDIELKERIDFMAETLASKKGFEIVALRVGHLTTLTDYFLLCSARSTTQVRALYDALDEAMEKKGIQVKTREGLQESRWIVMDYGFAFVHIFLDEVRKFYCLERLWTDETNITTYND